MTKLMLGLSLWLAAGAQAYVAYHTTTGQEVKWPNAQTTSVRYRINPADIGSPTTTQTFRQAINTSFRTWQSVSTSSLTYSYQGFTDAAGGELDNINCVDFSKDNEIFADGGYTEVIGLTVFSYDAGGNMLEADIIFNTGDYVFSTTQESNYTYIISATGDIEVTGQVNFFNVAVHEIGHFSGLGHSYIDGNLQSIRYDQYGNFLGPYPNLKTTATMFPYELNGSDSQTLEEDDKVGLSHLYPKAVFYSTRGALSGTVVSALDPTEPVFGAHVVAVNTGKKEVVGVLSQKNGSFKIEGLEPGEYRIFAEPIPFLETAAPYWQTAELQFPQEFFNNQFTFERAQFFDVVADGEVSGIEHTLLVGFSGVDVYEPNDTFLEFSDANPDAERFGMIDFPGDEDIFRFRALRGSLIHIEVLAQRQGTLVNPVLTVYNADEQAVAENSDYYGLNGDAQIDFRVPASGYYYVKVQHENANEGGEGFYYRLSIIAREKVVPMLASSDLTPVVSFELTSDRVLPEGDSRQLHLKQITLVLKDVGPPYGDFGIEDLATIADDITSGLSVFNDKGGTTPGVFEYNPNAVKGNDVRLPLDGSPDSAITVTKGVGQVTVQMRFAQGTSATLLPFTAEGKRQ